MPVCPLIFEPILRAKVWGGRNLGLLLGKNLPAAQTIGESWELTDLESAQSVVARGPAKGRTLHQLIEKWGLRLMGNTALTAGRFPLLIKFLDAVQPLSIQVHPDPDAAPDMGPGVRPKHEAWYVLHADPGAAIYRGLAPGVTVQTLRQVLTTNPANLIDCLARTPVKPGDACYLPGGTIHTLGPGVVVAEVQTPSDITYRLYDWDRTRPPADAGLHIEEALACIRPDVSFAEFERRSHVSSVFSAVSRIITCPSFKIERIRFSEEFQMEVPYGEPVCWIVLDGRGEVRYGTSGREEVSRGDVVLLPAGLEQPRVRALTDFQWLEVTMPAAPPGTP